MNRIGAVIIALLVIIALGVGYIVKTTHDDQQRASKQRTSRAVDEWMACRAMVKAQPNWAPSPQALQEKALATCDYLVSEKP